MSRCSVNGLKGLGIVSFTSTSCWQSSSESAFAVRNATHSDCISTLHADDCPDSGNTDRTGSSGVKSVEEAETVNRIKRESGFAALVIIVEGVKLAWSSRCRR